MKKKQNPFLTKFIFPSEFRNQLSSSRCGLPDADIDDLQGKLLQILNWKHYRGTENQKTLERQLKTLTNKVNGLASRLLELDGQIQLQNILGRKISYTKSSLKAHLVDLSRAISKASLTVGSVITPQHETKLIINQIIELKKKLKLSDKQVNAICDIVFKACEISCTTKYARERYKSIFAGDPVDFSDLEGK